MAPPKKNLVVSQYTFCDKNHFLVVKGLATTALLVAYLCGILFGFSYANHVRVMVAAVFLFCSGFGVSESYRTKGSLVHFWENKIIKIWLPCLLVLILFDLIKYGYVIGWMVNNPMAIKDSFMYVLFGSYAVFWLLFHFVEVEATRIVGLYVAAIIAFFCMDKDGTQVTLLAFPTGVLLSQTNGKYTVRNMNRLARILTTAVAVAITAAGWVLASSLSDGYLREAVWSLVMLCGACSVLLLVYILKDIKLLGFFAPLGVISYAVYLMYDYWISVLLTNRETETVVFTLLVLIVTASLLTWLRQLLIDWNKKIRRKKTHLKGMM